MGRAQRHPSSSTRPLRPVRPAGFASPSRASPIRRGGCRGARLIPLLAALALAAILAACGSRPARDGAPPATGTTRPGAYYADDGPGANPPPNLEQLADATPRWEQLHRFANRPYTVLGRDYVPATELRPYRERGIASWYGRKFHAQRTSTGETYDMYAMTAAHPTLPLPSYARVTNLANGKSVVVRVNDRGPFLHGRLIDLSFAAAYKLGYANQGSAQVEVEGVLPESPGLFAARTGAAAAALPTSVPPAPATTQLAVASPLSPPPPQSGVTTAPVTTPPAGTASALAPMSAAVPVERDVPLRAEGTGVFLQLGAFSNLDNAENFLALMEFQLSGNGNSGGEFVYAPRVRARDNLFRVELGPYASRGEAQRAAQDLESRFGIVPAGRSR